MSYMIFSSGGNAIDSFEDFDSAAKYFLMICESEPDWKDELVLIMFDEDGMAIDGFRYEDLI